jgi:hypothetical protein
VKPSTKLLESAALLLVVAAAACGESATEFEAKKARQAAYSPNPVEPSLDGLDPPVWTITMKLGTSRELIEHMPPGFVPPPGPYWGHDVVATGFPPGRSWSFQSLGRWRSDGRIMLDGAGGGGYVPADGVFRTGGVTNCPSVYSEMWVVVTIGTRVWAESPHFVPPC